MILNKKLVVISFLSLFLSLNVFAEGKSYTEDEFLRSFSGKSSKAIADSLGQPAKKEVSIKPTNADNMLAGKGAESKKPVNVEMWYYNNRVSYAPNKTYKFTELTFVNGKCANIAFFNNK
jgi:hypothetical protein